MLTFIPLVIENIDIKIVGKIFSNSMVKSLKCFTGKKYQVVSLGKIRLIYCLKWNKNIDNDTGSKCMSYVYFDGCSIRNEFVIDVCI